MGKNLEDRLGFIRKVYSILSLMLAISFGCVFFTTFNAGLNEWIRGQVVLVCICAVSTLIPVIMLACCTSISRSVPINYILLGLANVLFTVLMCFVTSFYKTNSVVVAAGMTLVMTIALTVFAYKTDKDFTMLGSAYLIIGVTCFMVSIAWFFIPQNSWWNHLFAGFFVLVYSFYIIWHTQLILGEKGEKLSIDDYAIGALLLYIDIIYLFMNLLRLMGDRG